MGCANAASLSSTSLTCLATLATFTLGVAAVVGGYGTFTCGLKRGLAFCCVGVATFCMGGCFGLVVGIGTLDGGAGAEILRLLRRLVLCLLFFCCCAAAFVSQSIRCRLQVSKAQVVLLRLLFQIFSYVMFLCC